MNTPLSPEEIDRLARKRAAAKMGWYVHLLVYALVNAAWFVAASQGWSRRPWVWAPSLGWGLGLVLHGAAVFLLGQGSSWREALVESERERIRRQQRP